GGRARPPRRRARARRARPGGERMIDSRPEDCAAIAECYGALRAAVGGVVVGQESAVRLSFITLLCSGHSLIEGVPGVAKTLLVQTLAAAVSVRFGRVQFTPDLMPSDIIGTSVLDTHAAGETRFRPGPLFTDLLLADEINRASAKPQVPHVLGAEELEACRAVVRAVIVREDVLAYVAALVRATRADVQFALGASPRAGVLLVRAAKAQAVLEGRDFVLPEDVQTMLLP